jgi:predicted ester cyclase
MSVEENKVIVRRIPEEVLNKGDLSVLDEIVAPGFVNLTPLPGLPDRGVEALRALVNTVRTAFPDLHYTLEASIAEGDMVVHLATARGTNTGPFMGMGPTGKSATWKEIHIVRVVNGKIVDHTGIIDEAGMMRQLGLIPATVQARP